MAHIAIINGGLIGRIHTSLEIGLRLQREGHIVTFLTQPYNINIISKKGFNCEPLPQIGFTFHDTRLKNDNSSWFQRFLNHVRHYGNHYEYGKKALNIEAHKRVLQQLKPDFLIIDVEVHDLIFVAHEMKIPIRLFTTWFCDEIGWSSPSIRTAITPGQGFWGGKAGIGLSWLFLRFKVYARVVVNRLKFVHYRRYVLKKYAKEIGYDTSELLVNTLPPLYSFSKSPILSTAMSELEFPHKFSENYSYVGPMVFENRIEPDENLVDVKRLDAIFNEKATSNKKIIYCAVGSLAKGDVSFLNKVINIVDKEKDWILILSLGRNLSKEDFLSVPVNVYLFNWVSQLRVLSKSDCCINHGGMNSINECIHHSVPMLIYSMKNIEQNGNAVRMAYHGLAIAGDKDKDSEVEIHKNLKKILIDESFRIKMASVNSLYHDYRQRTLSEHLFK